jgi:hypothetical protein
LRATQIALPLARLARAAFSDRLIGQVGGDGHAHAFATDSYCTATAIQDPAIRQQCEALAKLFADNGRDTEDLGAAARMGEALGWPSDRITEMNQEILATYRIETHSHVNPWNCENVIAKNVFANIQARSGELAAARAAIQQSGKSIPELAQEQMDYVREQQMVFLKKAFGGLYK